MKYNYDLISIIIPVANGDDSWRNLEKGLDNFPCEVIFIHDQKTRATAMNYGARKAKGEYFWFVHADSSITLNHVNKLLININKNKYSLHYFDLKFDGKYYMKLNEIGVWLRSHILHIPFGDQAFCIAKKIFNEIGGYDEEAAYGEDHLLVWQARQHGVPIISTGMSLKTSSRKYLQNGWLRTTILHQYLFLKQAIPQFIKPIRR